MPKKTVRPPPTKTGVGVTWFPPQRSQILPMAAMEDARKGKRWHEGETVRTFHLTPEHIRLISAVKVRAEVVLIHTDPPYAAQTLVGEYVDEMTRPLPKAPPDQVARVGITTTTARPYGNSDIEGDIIRILWEKEGDDADDGDLRAKAQKIHAEIPEAIQIVLTLRTFQPGKYHLVYLNRVSGVWLPEAAAKIAKAGGDPYEGYSPTR